MTTKQDTCEALQQYRARCDDRTLQILSQALYPGLPYTTNCIPYIDRLCRLPESSDAVRHVVLQRLEQATHPQPSRTPLVVVENYIRQLAETAYPLQIGSEPIERCKACLRKCDADTETRHKTISECLEKLTRLYRKVCSIRMVRYDFGTLPKDSAGREMRSVEPSLEATLQNIQVASNCCHTLLYISYQDHNRKRGHAMLMAIDTKQKHWCLIDPNGNTEKCETLQEHIRELMPTWLQQSCGCIGYGPQRVIDTIKDEDNRGSCRDVVLLMIRVAVHTNLYCLPYLVQILNHVAHLYFNVPQQQVSNRRLFHWISPMLLNNCSDVHINGLPLGQTGARCIALVHTVGTTHQYSVCPNASHKTGETTWCYCEQHYRDLLFFYDATNLQLQDITLDLLE